MTSRDHNIIRAEIRASSALRNADFKNQYERLTWKERALQAVSFVAGVCIAICLTALALILSRP